MFEHESTAVKYGIEFLTALMEKDYRHDPTFDVSDLQDKIAEIQSDINHLKSNLPYEAIDDVEEREHQYPNEFEDSAELEDEVVECDRLIGEANRLIAAVKDRYFSEVNTTKSETTSEHSAMLGHYFRDGEKKRTINWSNVILWTIIVGIIIWIILQDLD